MTNKIPLVELWFQDSVKPMWFNSTKEFDQQLKSDYESTYLSAKQKNYDNWQGTALEALELILLFDQIPLNIYRGEKAAFETERLAVQLTRKTIDAELDQSLNDEQKAFLYMPLMHSENIADQNLAVRLFGAAGLTENAKYAHHHRAIVEQFGRFPHRNKILGRESTAAELEYLSSGDAFLG